LSIVQAVAPNDCFHSEMPLYWRYCSKDPFQVFLGVWSPVRTITGHPALCSRDAKASAALEAIRQLYAVGFLDDHLSPVREVEETLVQLDPEIALCDADWISAKLLAFCADDGGDLTAKKTKDAGNTCAAH